MLVSAGKRIFSSRSLLRVVMTLSLNSVDVTTVDKKFSFCSIIGNDDDSIVEFSSMVNELLLEKQNNELFIVNA
jgi:hypothetical protein